MNLGKFLWTTLGITIAVSSTILLYWTVQPVQNLQTQYPVDVVTQTFGKASRIQIPQLKNVDTQTFYIYTTTIDLRGNLAMVTPALMFSKGKDTYSVLTYRNLPVGNYNVIVHLEYSLNPLRDAEQKFTLATLSVIGGEPNVISNNVKSTETVCPKDSRVYVKPNGRGFEYVPDALLYNGH